MNEQHSEAQRLLIISNRLPFTAVEQDGSISLAPSSGGLVSGLTAYLDSLQATKDRRPATINNLKSKIQNPHYLWLGWPGATVSHDNQPGLIAEASRVNAHPVFISEDEMESFYHGFCNSTIWPLFHYFSMITSYSREDWDTYRDVNQRFADTVMEVIQPNDIIWIHDYQLMLLPGLIRGRVPDAQIGFFLHIPFPGYELFRLMPRKWGREILEGLLGADLIGFHTHDYTRYFLRSVLRVLGYEHSMGRITVADRIVKTHTFPMGIDFARFHDAAATPEVQLVGEQLRHALLDTKILLSIDRLDYTKGILNRLEGYQTFLELHPEWHGKVALTLVVIPSRIGVGRYRETKEHIEEMVGRINGRFGTLGWVPIRYQYTSLPFDQLIALYHAADVAIVTPLRDGMNLIAKEYVAASTDTGVLILSEMAGAAKELGEAIIINPNSREEIADALHQALEMPADEQRARNHTMQDRLRLYDVAHWAEDFMHELGKACENRDYLKTHLMTAQARHRLISDYSAAKRRLILLDYDGTLMPFSSDPLMASPTHALLDLLSCLSADPRNDVVVISGRDHNTLYEWLGHLSIGLIAEHGIWMRPHGEDWSLYQPLANDWKSHIRPVLEMYADRLPGAFVEEKEYSLVWHYRASDHDSAVIRSQELLDHLLNFTANIDVQVHQGNKVIEVKSGGVNKGSTALYWRQKSKPDFTLAIGDDWTDEYLFKALPDDAYTIRVGLTQSHARYNLHDHTEALTLLADLSTQPRT